MDTDAPPLVMKVSRALEPARLKDELAFRFGHSSNVLDGGRVKRHLGGLQRFSRRESHDALVQVDVSELDAQRVPQPHPRHIEPNDKALPPKRRREAQCRAFHDLAGDVKPADLIVQLEPSGNRFRVFTRPHVGNRFQQAFGRRILGFPRADSPQDRAIGGTAHVDGSRRHAVVERCLPKFREGLVSDLVDGRILRHVPFPTVQLEAVFLDRADRQVRLVVVLFERLTQGDGRWPSARRLALARPTALGFPLHGVTAFRSARHSGTSKSLSPYMASAASSKSITSDSIRISPVSLLMH